MMVCMQMHWRGLKAAAEYVLYILNDLWEFNSVIKALGIEPE